MQSIARCSSSVCATERSLPDAMPVPLAVSAVMRANGSKNTKPELTVRRLLFASGYRYRLHCRHLPGKPDIVFPGRKKTLFVHGCFWHQHSSARCRLRSRPTSNVNYWGPKLQGNVDRDRRQIAALRRGGWSVMVVWECQVANVDRLVAGLRRFLGPASCSGGQGRIAT